MPKSRGKKVAKGKPPAVVDGQSTEEMSKDQLEEHIVRLREELDREREERSYFQLERDKIQAFWEIDRRNLEEIQAELRNRTREREEAEERHRVEITVYKQKLKHVLSEQHITVSGLKINTATSTSLIQNQNAKTELGLHRDKHDLQGALREKATNNGNCIKELKLKHQVELMQQANKNDGPIREMEVKYHRRMQSLVEAATRRHEEELGALEDRMRSQVEYLVKEHDKTLRGVEENHRLLHDQLTSEVSKAQEQLAVSQRRQTKAERDLSSAQKEIKHLREALQEAELELPHLCQQLQDYETEKAERVKRKAQLKLLEEEVSDLTLEKGLLLNAFTQLQQERDELLRLQQEAQQEVQQKSCLKEILLKKKLEALSQTLQRKDAQLFTSAEDAGENKLQEMFLSKHVSITELQTELSQNAEEYDHLMLTCRDRLEALGVPLTHCPPRPSHHILGGRPQGKSPTGTTH